ncbi:hypothetical protein B0H10DRAFT_474109 [Mycena sp. CBHHK59/15]|nr:hypothetical protein B0H10DRAFT_474109 [Mycena sp. CBHHK59/15]
MLPPEATLLLHLRLRSRALHAILTHSNSSTSCQASVAQGSHCTANDEAQIFDFSKYYVLWRYILDLMRHGYENEPELPDDYSISEAYCAINTVISDDWICYSILEKV